MSAPCWTSLVDRKYCPLKRYKITFQAINGGDVVINDITIGGNTGGFYVGTGSLVSANTIYVHDSATAGIEVNGTMADLSVNNLRFKGAPNLRLIKVSNKGNASLRNINIDATGKCPSPCKEMPAIKIYENSSLSLEGGQIKWNRPGHSVYSEVYTDMTYVDSLTTGAILVERTYTNDTSGKGAISIGGTFASRNAPANNYQNLPLLEIKHPDGVGLELRHNQAKANLIDVVFSSGGGNSIFLGKDASFSGDDLRFGNSRGTHILISEHTSKSRAPRISNSTFSNNASVVLDIRNCSSGSAVADFTNNTWKKNAQGSSASGHYAKAQVKGPIFGSNVSINTNCSVNI